eukprot:scaffold4276_cov19-Tisochrysis_lutea.AAC.1
MGLPITDVVESHLTCMLSSVLAECALQDLPGHVQASCRANQGVEQPSRKGPVVQLQVQITGIKQCCSADGCTIITLLHLLLYYKSALFSVLYDTCILAAPTDLETKDERVQHHS